MNDMEELMAESPQLSIELRERAGKGAARTTRRAGRVPGVIYGAKQEPLLISLDPRELSRELHKIGFFATLFDLKLDSASHRVLPRDVQFDPVTDKPLHGALSNMTSHLASQEPQDAKLAGAGCQGTIQRTIGSEPFDRATAGHEARY